MGIFDFEVDLSPCHSVTAEVHIHFIERLSGFNLFRENQSEKVHTVQTGLQKRPQKPSFKFLVGKITKSKLCTVSDSAIQFLRCCGQMRPTGGPNRVKLHIFIYS
jgi:hypothetical protein